jgi:hypothetical protein
VETLVLTLDTIALMVVIYFSYKSGKSPERPDIGPFRIRAPEAAVKVVEERKTQSGRVG